MPKENRERMAEVVFEDFDIPAMYVANEAVLALYSSGLVDGLVVESGESATHAVPVSNGWLLPSAVNSVDLGGCAMTEFFARVLKESGYQLVANVDRDILRNAKEQLAYVSQDFEKESDLASSGSGQEKSYEMPDGKVEISVNFEFELVYMH
jgi:actin-related protein